MVCPLTLGYLAFGLHLGIETDNHTGPIIRISPYEVHVNDPEFQDKLYRQDGRWNKYGFAYESLGNPLSMHGTLDHYAHRMRRAALNPFFSKQKISSLTPIIQAQIEKLSSRLDGFVDSGKVVPIGAAYSAFTMDVVTDYILEKSYGNLDCEDFNTEFVTTIADLGFVWRAGKHIRWLSMLFYNAPMWAVRMTSPSMIRYKIFLEVCPWGPSIFSKPQAETSLQECASSSPEPCLGRP